jgi:hypothetical protein
MIKELSKDEKIMVIEAVLDRFEANSEMYICNSIVCYLEERGMITKYMFSNNTEIALTGIPELLRIKPKNVPISGFGWFGRPSIDGKSKRIEALKKLLEIIKEKCDEKIS